MKWEDWETLSPCRSNGTRKCPQSPGLLLGNSPQRLPTCPGEGETGELSCLEAPFPEPLLPGAPSLSPSNTSVGGRRCSPAPAGGAWPGRPVTTPQGPDDPRTPHTGPHPKPRGSESHFLSTSFLWAPFLSSEETQGWWARRVWPPNARSQQSSLWQWVLVGERQGRGGPG